MKTIPYKLLKLIKNFIVIILLLSTALEAKELFSLKNAQGQSLTIRLALTKEEHALGLSGLKKSDFSQKDGLLFVNSEVSARRFWMPDTYFNLNIIFLDSNLKVVAIERNVPHHPGRSEPPNIYVTKTYQAQFILETRADSPFSQKIKINDQLKFIGPTSLLEIARETRQMR